MQVRKYSSGCGAVVTGIDLAHFSEGKKRELWKAFLEHGVLFFVDQKLTPEDHIAFAKRLGSIVINKLFPENTAHPEIAEVRKEKEQRTNIGGGWHADHSYDEAPALGSILVCARAARGGRRHPVREPVRGLGRALGGAQRTPGHDARGALEPPLVRGARGLPEASSLRRS